MARKSDNHLNVAEPGQHLEEGQNLDERLRFERLISRLSASFVNLPAGEIDKEIEKGLQHIVQFLEIDRGTLGMFSEDGKELRFTHSWAVQGSESLPLIVANDQWPWAIGLLRRGKIVKFSNVEELPKEAVVDQQSWMKLGAKSHITIPLAVGGSTAGTLTFAATRAHRAWPQDLVRRLQLVAELFTNVLERKRAAEALEAAQHGLEREVEKRTAQLVNANEQLKREIEERKRSEDSLQFERSQLLSIFNSIPQIIYIADPGTYEILYVNETVKKAFEKNPVGGICYEEFQGLKSPCEFCTNDIILREKPKPYQWEYHNPVLNRDYLLIDKIIKWPDGRDVRFEIAVDITERKRAEEALRRQSQYLLALHETSLGVLKRFDEEDLLKTILERAALLAGAENGFVLLSESDQGEMEVRVGIGFHTRVARRRYKRSEGLTGRVWKTGKPVFVPDYRSWEHRLPHEELDALRSVIGVPLKSGEKVIGIIALSHVEEGRMFDPEDLSILARFADLATIALDNRRLYEKVCHELTQRAKIEAALRESETQKEGILDASIDKIRLVDRNMRIIWANKTTTRELNLAPEDVVGQTCHELLFGRTSQCDGCPTQKALESGEIEQAIIHQPESDGIKEGTYWDDYAVPIKNEAGDVVSIIQITRNVTERMKAEEEKRRLEAQLLQAQKMESIGTLAGGIAHDFNNILGIILGNTELAMGDVPEWDSARRNLEEVYKVCLRGRDLVRQMLAFSRRNEQERYPVKIGQTVKESLKLLRSTIPTTIDIRQNISTESDLVRADATQIDQVILNLCVNAAYAMSDKGGTLEIGLEGIELGEKGATRYHELEPGRYVRLRVRDTGHGIKPEVMERIFDPYFTTKGVGEGTGMGLSLVHGIVKSHGGAVTVDSTPGKGATFDVFLPVVEGAPAPKADRVDETPTGTETILFVDDEKGMVDTVKPILERFGYEVHARTSSIEALEAFRAVPGRFDLVITDQTMPNMTGAELAKALLQIRPDIPIILCTGFSELISEEKARNMGIRAFVMKPIVMSQIARTVREVLDKVK